MERHKEQVSTTVIAVRIESRISGRIGKTGISIRRYGIIT